MTTIEDIMNEFEKLKTDYQANIAGYRDIVERRDREIVQLRNHIMRQNEIISDQAIIIQKLGGYKTRDIQEQVHRGE